MKKILVLILVALAAIGLQAQISWPPKKLPAKVPFILSAEIEYYWGIKSIICTGRSGGGYKFKASGIANHDHSSAQVDILYMKPAAAGKLPSASVAGSYFLPEITKGKPFYFDFVAAWPGMTPSRFSLMFKSDWIRIPENADWNTLDNEAAEESVSQIAVKSPEPELVQERVCDEKIIPLEESKKDSDEVFEAVEEMPQFPGGNQAMMKWLGEHLRYPTMAEYNGVKGRVVIVFVIDESGRVTDAKVLRGADPDLDREALRLVESMPNFIPGKSNGKPVKVRYTIPIKFG